MKIDEKHNWLKMVFLCIGFSIGITGCKSQKSVIPTEISETFAEKSDQPEPETIQAEQQTDQSETEASISGSPDNLNENYTSNGVFLECAGTTVFGPCKFIYDDYYNSRFFRFIDQENGLIGYAKNEKGNISVLVPGRYSQAFKFSERQDEFARVQNPDGTWALINEHGETIFDGFDSINRLPLVDNLATGVKDGQAVLLDLDTVNFQTEPTIKKIYPEYKEISELYDGFAVVTGKDGKQGVIRVDHDEMVIPAKYETVEWRNALVEEMEGMTRTVFLCRKADGTYDVFSRIHERIIKFDSAERINIKYVLRHCFVSFPLIL